MLGVERDAKSQNLNFAKLQGGGGLIGRGLLYGLIWYSMFGGL